MVGAIGSGVTATLSLRAAQDHPAWYALVAAGYISAFVALSFAVRTEIGIGIGATYGIWVASGVALTAVLASCIFGDPLTAKMWLGIALIMGGVLCVGLGSHTTDRAARATRRRADNSS